MRKFKAGDFIKCSGDSGMWTIWKLLSCNERGFKAIVVRRKIDSAWPAGAIDGNFAISPILKYELVNVYNTKLGKILYK